MVITCSTIGDPMPTLRRSRTEVSVPMAGYVAPLRQMPTANLFALVGDTPLSLPRHA